MADNTTITPGTGLTLATDDVSSVHYPKIKLDVGADGVSSAFTGTIGAVTNLAGGTVGILTAGTVTNVASGSVVVTNGTIGAGSIVTFGYDGATNRALLTNTRGGLFVQTLGTEVNPPNEWTASGNLTGTATGTIKAAVTGSVIYVTSLIVSVESSGRVSIASGTPISPIIGTMNFNANGGIAAMPLNPPLRTTSGSALVFNQSGTGVLGYWAAGFTE